MTFHRAGSALIRGRSRSKTSAPSGYAAVTCSCHRFGAAEVGLQLGVIAHNIGDPLHRLVADRHGLVAPSLQQWLLKTGG